MSDCFTCPTVLATWLLEVVTDSRSFSRTNSCKRLSSKTGELSIKEGTTMRTLPIHSDDDDEKNKKKNGDDGDDDDENENENETDFWIDF